MKGSATAHGLILHWQDIGRLHQCQPLVYAVALHQRTSIVESPPFQCFSRKTRMEQPAGHSIRAQWVVGARESIALVQIIDPGPRHYRNRDRYRA
jgi:hypothetical protein